jgi:hypothetical protein
MSFEGSKAFDDQRKPKIDKFAALAAAQQQKATDAAVVESHITDQVRNNPMDEGGTKDVEMLIDHDESTPNSMDIKSEYSMPPPSSEPVIAQRNPPRRDKFASMAAAAAAAETSTTTNTTDRDRDTNTTNTHTTKTTQRTTTNDKFAAVQQRKQVDDQNQQRQRWIELCSQRDSIWNDCDLAEHAVTDLLKYAEQTATLLSKNTIASSINADSYMKSKEQLSQLIHDYQSTVVQVHDLLSKHAHHVLAYKSNIQRHGETISNGSNNNTSTSMYTQRVEYRLAETKRQLIQDLLTSIREESDVAIEFTNSVT